MLVAIVLTLYPLQLLKLKKYSVAIFNRLFNFFQCQAKHQPAGVNMLVLAC